MYVCGCGLWERWTLIMVPMTICFGQAIMLLFSGYLFRSIWGHTCMLGFLLNPMNKATWFDL